ncbi:MAG: hypothetical protein H0W88_06710 [Parachlamydiaceae bacterium]|nr:hypothetical protein [Parachlamydiaceae bacterium]
MIDSIKTLYQRDNTYADMLLIPQRCCNSQWKHFKDPLEGSFGEKTGTVIKRIVIFAPLVILTLGSYLIGAIGVSIKGTQAAGAALQRIIAPSKFQKGANEITNALKLEPSKTKEEGKKILEQLFVNLKGLKPITRNDKNEFDNLTIEILSRYGDRTYPEFNKAEIYLTASLQLQLQKIRAVSSHDLSDFATLDDFEKRTPVFDDVIRYLKTNGEFKLIKNSSEKLTNKQKLVFADTLTTLGAVYINLQEKSLQLEKGPYLKVMVGLYDGIINILTSLPNDKNIKGKLGELQYNNFPTLYLEQCKLKNNGVVSAKELQTSFEILDKAYTFNPTLPMKARIANLKSCRARDLTKDLPLAKKYVVESLALWEEVMKNLNQFTDSEKERFQSLQTNVMNNYLSILLTTGEGKLEELEKYADYSRAYYPKNKDTNPYCMIHLVNLANLEVKKGNKEQALAYINEINDISKKWISWPHTQNLIDSATKLKASIEK